VCSFAYAGLEITLGVQLLKRTNNRATRNSETAGEFPRGGKADSPLQTAIQNGRPQPITQPSEQSAPFCRSR